MSVFFDYSTLLKNSYQIAKAELSKIIGSTTESDYYCSFTSETLVNPSDSVFFYSLINPGHAGTATLIEYFFRCLLDPVNIATLAYEWQIKPSGGAWTTIVSGSAVSGAASAVNCLHSGVYTTPTLLPAEIRLVGTDDDNSWFVTLGTTSYTCSVRCIGTV